MHRTKRAYHPLMRSQDACLPRIPSGSQSESRQRVDSQASLRLMKKGALPAFSQDYILKIPHAAASPAAGSFFPPNIFIADEITIPHDANTAITICNTCKIKQECK
jgi:hypothetical protein